MTNRILAILLVALASLTARAEEPLHGVSNLVGNDETLAYLESLRQFEGLDGGSLRTRIWFDPYVGNDSTGDGSYTLPYRSVEKMKAICTSGSRCTIKSRGRSVVFSPLTLAITSSSYLLGEQTFRRGDTVTWDSAASSGTVLDWDVDSNTLVIDRDTGTDPTTGGSEVIVASNPSITVSVTSVTNTINLSGGTTVDDPVTPNCADRDRVCILYEAEDPAFPAIIDGNGFGTLGNTTADDCGLFTGGGSGSGGWGAVQNIRVQNMAADSFTNCFGHNAKMMILNPAVNDTRNGIENRQSTATNNNNCFTTHGSTGSMVVINARQSETRVDSSGGNGGCLAPTGGQKLTILGGGPFTSQSARFTVSAFTDAGDIVTTSTPHLLTTGKGVVFSGTLPTGLTVGTTYFACSITATTFTLATLTDCVTPVTFTTGGLPAQVAVSFSSATLAMTGGDVVIVNAGLRGSLTTANNIVAAATTEAAGSRIQLARVLTNARVANAFAEHLSMQPLSGGLLSVIVREFTGAGRGRVLGIGALAAALVSLDARAFSADGADYWIATVNNTTSVTNARISVRGVYDDDDAGGSDANEWLVGGSSYATRATFIAAAAAINPTWSDSNLFGRDSAESGGASVDGTQWGSDTVHFRCSSARECWRARVGDEPYVVDLSGQLDSTDTDDSCPPADLIGRRFCSLSLKYLHHGAR